MCVVKNNFHHQNTQSKLGPLCVQILRMYTFHFIEGTICLMLFIDSYFLFLNQPKRVNARWFVHSGNSIFAQLSAFRHIFFFATKITHTYQNLNILEDRSCICGDIGTPGLYSWSRPVESFWCYDFAPQYK